MLIKTSELIGRALDWAVYECEKQAGRADVYMRWYGDGRKDTPHDKVGPFRPSTDWAQGGLIIDRHDIDILRDDTDNKVEPFGARTGRMVKYPTRDAMVWGFGRGPTKLIAAMRCYVASKLGEEVDVPEDLV